MQISHLFRSLSKYIHISLVPFLYVSLSNASCQYVTFKQAEEKSYKLSQSKLRYISWPRRLAAAIQRQNCEINIIEFHKKVFPRFWHLSFFLPHFQKLQMKDPLLPLTCPVTHNLKGFPHQNISSYLSTFPRSVNIFPGVNKKLKKFKTVWHGFRGILKLSGRVNQANLKLSAGFSNTVC